MVLIGVCVCVCVHACASSHHNRMIQQSMMSLEHYQEPLHKPYDGGAYQSVHAQMDVMKFITNTKQ